MSVRVARFAAVTTLAASAACAFWPGGLRGTTGATATQGNLTTGTITDRTFGTGRARHMIAISFAHPAGRGRSHRPAPGAARHATRSPRRVTRPVAPPLSAPRPAPAPVAPPVSGCAAAIAAVEAKGLYPAPGFAVFCPGNALGQEGMTCLNIPGTCPGQRNIEIAMVTPYVVANEFENSHILLGSPGICDSIDCGGSAYGF